MIFLKKITKNFLNPPSFFLKQIGSLCLMGWLTNWEKFFKWSIIYGFKALNIANGAFGMGCIGFPGHPVWEITEKCNLNCVHCHAKSFKNINELSTKESKKLIYQIAQMKEFRTLVFTGGEPLMRSDIFELLEYAKKNGLKNILATNGTLIDIEIAKDLKKCGVICNAISIDSCNQKIHNIIRNNKNAFNLALNGIKATQNAGIFLQINITIIENNNSLKELLQLINFVNEKQAGIVLIYQLITIGNGFHIKENVLLKKNNEKLLKLILKIQKNSMAILEPVAGPQYWAYMIEKKSFNNKYQLKLAEQVFHGCSAGKDFIYIKSNGDIWACPFLEISGGNIKNQSLSQIYYESNFFKIMKNKQRFLQGNCGCCKYKNICGGCRAKAHILKGNFLTTDPDCNIFIKND